MIITAIEKQKNNPKCYNVYIDGDYCFSADCEDILEIGIKENDIIDDGELQKILYKCQFKKAYNKVIKYIALMARSEYEVRKKLERDGFNDIVIDEVVMRLKELHYIDDLELCKHWISERKSLKLSGVKKIAEELRGKGIGRHIIEEALNQCEYDELDTAVRLIDKKIRQMGNRNLDNELYLKIYRFLIYKGIGYEDARKALSIYFNKDIYSD